MWRKKKAQIENDSLRKREGERNKNCWNNRHVIIANNNDYYHN